MRLKIEKDDIKATTKSGLSRISQFLQVILKLSPNKNLESTKYVKTDSDIVSVTDDIDLYIDIIGDINDAYSDKSGKLDLVIYTGDSPQFSDSSTPCIVFSLSSLIDEKIELLDASLASQKKVMFLQRLATQLSNQSSLLKDALKRNQINSGRMSDKNSPLW